MLHGYIILSFGTQENIMEQTLSDSCDVIDGIPFAVTVCGDQKECVVTLDALEHLRRMHGFTLDLNHIYRAFEGKIHSVARGLIFSGKRGAPLILGPQVFH
jgi:hypothetical protein